VHVPYLTFPHFKKYISLSQVYSNRMGGFSKPPYDSMNLGLHSGDNIKDVQANRDIFFKQIQIPPERMVFPAQIHSANVFHVTSPGIVPDCDALITSEKELYLTIQTADCFPVFLYEPQVEAVGIVHSGWRGTSKNIVGRTINLMVEKFECTPVNTVAAIGAGVQQACYQVDDTTATKFDSKYLLDDGPGHFKLDVQARIVDQLQESGVLVENVEIDPTCTHCATDLYYSYRRDGKSSGRMMGIIGIKNI